MEENRDMIITLLDEEDRPVQFDLLMTFDYEGKRYSAMLPIDPVEGVSDDEVVLLETVKEKDGEVYRPIENPVLLDEVFDEFMNLFDEQFEEDEEA